MPTPKPWHPHESIDLSGKLPVIDGGDIEVETIGPWHLFVDETRYRFNPPDRVLVTERTARSLEEGRAGRIVRRPEPEPEEATAKPKRKKKKRAPEDKAERAEENKAVPFGE